MSIQYNIYNSTGENVITIDPATTTGAEFPINFFGYGWSPFCSILLQNDYQNMENFASPTHPTNAVTGMWNFSTLTKNMYYYDSTNWQQVVTANNSTSTGFMMDTSASNIDFTQIGSTVIFTYPNDGKTYHPVTIMFIPIVTPTNMVPPTFNLSIKSPSDVMEGAGIINASMNSHTIFSIDGTTRFLNTSGDELSINITSPANNILKMRVLVFGLIS